MNTKILSAALCAFGCAMAITPAGASASRHNRHASYTGSHRRYHMIAIKSPTPLMALGSQDYLSDTSTTIALAGQDVLRVRSGAAGFTPQQRAEAIRLRLIPIQSIKDLNADDVRVAEMPAGERAITVRGHLLATIDHRLAAENNATPAQLADTWANNLRTTLPESRVAP